VNQRWTFALLAVAAALGAWVWFGEIKGDERKQAAEAATKQFFALAPKDVTALELSLGGGATAKLVRSEAGWKLESPVAYPADGDAVERALANLEKLSYTVVISPAPADLEQFGLGADARHVRAFAGGGEPKEVLVGGTAPVSGGRYLALAGEPSKLYVVDPAGAAGLTPTLLQLRDKRLLRAASGAVSDFTVRKNGAVVARASRTDAGWQLVEPEAAPGDKEKIERTLEEIGLARASDFSSPDAVPEEYGFAKPDLELALVTPAGTEQLALASAGGKTWVRREGDPVLLQVNPAVLNGVPTAFFDYRAKRVLTLDTAAVHALELAFPRSGQSHRFERTGDDWKPVEPGLALRPLKLEDLVFALSSLEASGLEPAGADRKALGLEPPAVTIRALDAKGGELGALSLGDPAAPAGVPALSSQHPEVWRVPNELGREVPLTAEAFQNAFVKAPEPKPAAPASP
jgi:hypothetical protein